MSVMDRLLSYMKLNGDEDYDDEYDDDEYDDYEEPETKVSKLTSRKTKSAPVEEEEEPEGISQDYADQAGPQIFRSGYGGLCD